MSRSQSRRGFVKGVASALALPVIVPSRALGLDGAVAPSNRITTATIGLGDRGPNHLDMLSHFKEVEILGVCDVRRERAEQLRVWVDNKQNKKGCLAAQDFRELLARPDLDAVTIAAPENWHAYMSIAAMRAGKDVYCEKALALTVAEGRAVCEAVKRTGRILQAGIQQRSDRNFRFACELARNGYLGKLHTVSVAVPSGRRKLKLEAAPVPASLAYDLWLGPAPFKPYRAGIDNFNWYFFRDYCAGWIQSWGVHHLDVALWGAPVLAASTLEIEGKASFEAEGDADVSFGWNIKMRTPDGLVMAFYDDASSPVRHGVRFAGDKGWVQVERGRIWAEPANLLEAVIKPGEEHLYLSGNHMENFLQCIKTRRQPVAPAEACQQATAVSLAADIASRAGRKLVWDNKAERFTNDDASNRLLVRNMRQGWEVA
jgi:predicted dehydrogenase